MNRDRKKNRIISLIIKDSFLFDKDENDESKMELLNLSIKTGKINLSLLNKLYQKSNLFEFEFTNYEFKILISTLDYLMNIRLREIFIYLIYFKDKLVTTDENFIGDNNYIPISNGIFEEYNMLKTYYITNRRISCGNYHTIAIDNNDDIVAWGDSLDEQIYNIPKGDKFKSVSCQNVGNLGLSIEGNIYLYEDNRRRVFTDGDAKMISSGEYHSAAIKSDGKLVIWDSKFLFVEINESFIFVTCGSYRVAAIKNNGDIYYYNVRELITGNKKQKTYIIKGPFVLVSCGWEYIVAIRGNGSLFVKSNYGHHLNIPDGIFKQVCCGKYHIVALKYDGTVITFGDNSSNQCVNSPIGKFIKTYCGENHSVGIREDRTIVTWGDNLLHQYDDSPEGTFIEVACGRFHSSAIRYDGLVITWGNDDYDQRDGIPTEKIFL